MEADGKKDVPNQTKIRIQKCGVEIIEMKAGGRSNIKIFSIAIKPVIKIYVFVKYDVVHSE